MSLRLAVGLVDMPTRWTRSARVARIDKDNRHTSKRCLVADKPLQLCKRPRLQYRTLLPLSPHPRLNMLEVFKRYPTLCAFGNLYELFGEHMVGMGCEAVLLPRQLAKATTRAMRALALQFATKPPMPIAHAFDRSATMNCAVAINRDIRDTQVNPEHPFNVKCLRRLHVTDRQKVEGTAKVGQICFTVPGLKQGPLALTTHEGDRLPAVKRPDRHGWLVEVPTQDAVIVGDAPSWPEGALAVAIQFVAIGNFADTAHSHLGGKAECFANVGIGQFVEVKLLEGLGLPGGCADAITCGISLFKRLLQGVGLFRRGKELQLGDQLHPFIVLKGCDMNRHKQARLLKRVLPPLGLNPHGIQD